LRNSAIHAFAASSGVGASLALGALELVGIGFIDWAIAVLGGVAAAFVAWMLFPVIAAELVYVFLDEIADAVEARHYPHLPKIKPASMWQYTGAGIRLGLVMGFFNLLILPISFIPVVQVIYPFLYMAINGMLLGREYLEVVGPRRISFKEVRALRRRHRFKVFVSGVVIALLFLIPVFNLVAPVVATAFMVHIYHGLNRSRA
jgi:uncharacterized protein involved in cysteine biosynthesis